MMRVLSEGILTGSGEPLRTERTTGLTVEQFADLCALVLQEIGTWAIGRGRPKLLSLGQAVKVTVMYDKNNITEEVLSELFGVSQPTISRAITEPGYTDPFRATRRK
jgi:hypothetical protein